MWETRCFAPIKTLGQNLPEYGEDLDVMGEGRRLQARAHGGANGHAVRQRGVDGGADDR